MQLASPLQLPDARPAPAEVERLLSGAHHDPHAVLGVHPVEQGVAVRVLRPGAERVELLTPAGPLALVPGPEGLFAALLPITQLPDYKLLVSYPGGKPLTQEDGYRFTPTLGELDLHLIREGRHERLWEALGSHVRTVDGV
ncbi:GlgB N-terminal domain-containing protein, partial [Kitasatospora sp. LaBMicrA B282]|uniref:GlgB N-terminal domain-containing protein n=1 Tax=Kitasatospora sp. LaBMicrA B282 TaxID=3420949 RepID=UPI003D0B51B5